MVEILEQTDRRMRMRCGRGASTSICTLDRDSGIVEVARLALGIPYKRKRTPIGSVHGIVVRRRASGKTYQPFIEVHVGMNVALGDFGKEEALAAARAIREFLRSSA